MKIQPLLIALTVINMALLVSSLLQSRTVAAEAVAPVLRGRALQIVDDQGRVRASIQVLPASTRQNGELSVETVLLRLITEKGRPSVKIAASEQGAGMALTGPSNTKDTYVQLKAEGTASSVKLKNEDGREQIIKP